MPFNVQTCTPYKRFSMIELIAPYIFQSPFLSFVFSGISKVLFIYLRSLPLITTHTDRKLNFLKKQTIGHKRSMEYKVKDQDILLTYERLICRHLAQDKNPRSHSNNGKILECLFALHSSYFFCIFDLIA